MGYHLNMSTKRRNYKIGYPYHIYNRGNKKEAVFLDDSDYEYFISILIRYSKAANVIIVAYCLMKNHYHLLVVPYCSDSISTMMQKIGIAYHYNFRKRYKIVGHIFQGRYNSKVIENHEYLEVVKEYILNNPVKKEYMKTGQQYRWSYFDEKSFLILSHMFKLIALTKNNS
jgi:REP element-mobilizing transposase RayT